jgi:hypothetical protein
MDGIKVILDVYLGGINEIYDFFISIVFSFPFGDMAILKKLNGNFHFKFQKIKNSNFLKMKIFKIFISNFHDIFQFFKFQSKFQNRFFSNFSISYGQFF